MEVIEVVEREVEVIELIERGPVGPTGPQPNINYEVVSSARTLEAADLIAADTSGGAFTLTLPLNPSNGDAVDIFDFSETFDTNPLTIARNGQPIESLNEDLVANVEGAYFTLIYTGSTRGWQVLPRYGTSGGGGESALTTEGDMLYRGPVVNTRLGIGTAGQILKVNSSATAPEWGAAPATGVTSVGITGSDGIEVDSGSPVTGSGSIALGVNAATLRSHINVADGAEVNVQSNWTEANSGSDAFILNKPTLGTAAAQDSTAFAAAVHTHTPSEVGLGNVSNTAQVISVTGTAPIVSSGGTTPAISISAATTSAAGSMSSADKTKLDGIAAGAEVNVNADWNASSGDAQILNKPTLGNSSALDVGTTTGTVAAGDDARLSDPRDPNAHANSHAAAGSDPLAPSDIGAQSIFVTEDLGTITANVTLTAARAKIYLVNSQTSGLSINLPTTNIMAGDVVQIRFTSFNGQTLAVKRDGNFYGSSLVNGQQATYIAASTAANSWEETANNRHAHGNITNEGRIGTVSGLPIKTSSGGLLSAGAFGTSAGQFAEGNHTHELNALAATGITAGKILTADGDDTASWQDAPAGGDTVSIEASAADVLSVTSGAISAVDATADKIVFWDDSASELTYLELGSGLSISGTTLSATATGTIGGSTGSTDNAIVRADSTANTVQDSALVIDDATTSTQANVALVNNHSETNSSLVLTPKGTGAFIVGPKPDGAATVGGNARGTGAVDLVTSRTAATQVASGNYSFACGQATTASGLKSFAFNASATAESAFATGGGTASGTGAFSTGGTASGFRSAVVGGTGTASNTQAVVCGGSNATANGQRSFVGAGTSNNASANDSAVVGGTSNIASAQDAAVIGGSRAAANRRAMIAHAGGRFAADGDAQRIRSVLFNKTTTNAAVELFIDGSSTRLTVPSGKVMAMLINITGSKSDGSAVAHYVRQYAIKNVGGTTSEVYAAVTIGTDNAAGTSIALSANDTNDALNVEVTGIASETWRWVASVDAVEVAYGS